MDALSVVLNVVKKGVRDGEVGQAQQTPKAGERDEPRRTSMFDSPRAFRDSRGMSVRCVIGIGHLSSVSTGR